MSILWGPWNAQNRLRAGSELFMFPTTVSSSTTSVKITVRIYMQTRYASSESGGSTTPWTSSNGFTPSGGNAGGWNLGAMGTKQIASAERIIPTTGSAQPVPVVSTFYSSYAYPGQSATVNNSITIPKKPTSGPGAPTSVTASRTDDTKATVRWTNGSGQTSKTVQMQTFYNGWSDYATVGSPSASATSLVVTGLSPNRIYRFQVRSNNSAGSSSYVAAAGYAFMTPIEPRDVLSQVAASGTSITTTWVNEVYGGPFSPGATFEVQRSVNGGTYAALAGATALTGTTWTDTAPDVGSNRYQVRSKAGVPELTSGWAEGNIISTIIAPLAPTLLDPNGVAFDLTAPVTLTWKHNHGGDGALQSHFTLQTSADAGATWVTRADNVASADSLWVLPAGTLTNGITYQWRVMTQGSTAKGFGPYSTVATLTGSKVPTVTIAAPGATITALPLTVTRTYTQAQSSPQATTETELYDAAGSSLLESVSTNGTGLTHTLTYRLIDGVTYQVRVRSQSAAGLWSAWVTRTSTVDLPEPAGASINGSFSPCEGIVMLSMASLAPGAGQIAAAFHVIERRLEGDTEWVTLDDHFITPGDFIDTLTPINSQVEYRITSVSALPSYTVNPVVTVSTEAGDQQWVFVSFGPGFTRIVRVRGEPKVGEVTGRDRAVEPMAGRDKPILLVGANRSRVVSFSGSLYYDATCDEDDACRFDSPPQGWRTLSHEAETVAYRDMYGRRLFGLLSDVQVEEGATIGVASVSFSVTEDDTVENYELSSGLGG